MSKLEFILALDPGVTTGWAMGEYRDTEPLTFIGGGQITGGVVGFGAWVREMEVIQAVEEEELTIVSENFTLRPGVKFPNLEPIRIEGAMTALFGPNTVHYQSPVLKSTVGDAKLKELGFWDASNRHQMDARIHALAYMKLSGHMPTIKAYWPEIEE